MKTSSPNNAKIAIVRNQVKDARHTVAALRSQLNAEIGRLKSLRYEVKLQRNLVKIVREDQARIRAEKRAAREAARQARDAARIAKAQARLENLQATIAKRAVRSSKKASAPVVYSPEQIAALNAERGIA